MCQDKKVLRNMLVRLIKESGLEKSDVMDCLLSAIKLVSTNMQADGSFIGTNKNIAPVLSDDKFAEIDKIESPSKTDDKPSSWMLTVGDGGKVTSMFIKNRLIYMRADVYKDLYFEFIHERMTTDII